jgi:hypothetical protein
MHQEHRNPLSKLALVARARAVPDVRAAAVLDVLGCAGFVLVALAAVHRLRGRLRSSDALIPLLALHVGHYTTFLLGFQLQMVISTGLVLSVFTLLLEPTRGRVAVAGGLLALLPLAGLNGVVAAPPLVLWLFWLLGSASRRSPSALGLGAARRPPD